MALSSNYITRTFRNGSQPILLIFLVFSLTFLSSCAYRFTNRYAAPPPGVRSIAIEGIFDTSKEPLAHDILWHELQRAFASNGRLQVTAPEQADAIVRTHIRQVEIIPSGTEETTTAFEEPPVLGVSDPTPPNDPRFRQLTLGETSMNKETLAVVIDVQVLNLSSREILFTKTYLSNDEALIKDGAIPPNYQFLRAEEASSASFQSISRGIASDVVRSLFTTL